MTIISGHQPVYLPWLGFFHKLSLCDVFVFMDTVQYLEKDWNNRNKVRTPQGWMWLTVPIDRRETEGNMLDQIIIRGHDALDIKGHWQVQHLRSLEINYRQTPFFEAYEAELRAMYLDTAWKRLVDLCWAQFTLFTKWLGLDDRRVVRMSEMPFEGKKDRLILDQCRKLEADAVVFGAQGRDYVDVGLFHDAAVQVYFQDYNHPVYPQRFKGFEPSMCILDLLFNHGPDSRAILQQGNVTIDKLRQGRLWEPVRQD